MNFVKDPGAVLDFAVDWTAWLDGDSISASAWEVPDELAATKESFTGEVATIWLGGGVIAKTYMVTNHITTSAGRQDFRTLKIAVENR